MASDSTWQEFFHATPALIPLFQALANAMEARYPLATLRIQKSQIAFCAPRAFCYVWLPVRWGIRGRPDVYLVLSFGLDKQIQHPRIVDANAPAPGRWMNHVIIGSVADIDGELFAWIDQAYYWRNPAL